MSVRFHKDFLPFILPFLLFSFLLPIHHPSALAAKETAAADTKLPDVQTYEQLVKAIRSVQAVGQERIEAAVDRENVREAWETGQLIMAHVLRHQERADYGERVLEKLSGEVGKSVRELRYMVEFAREYPIQRPAAELSWAHYQALLALNDPKERTEVEAEAVRNHWTRDQVREEVRRRNPRAVDAAKPGPVPEITPGKPGVYRVIRAKAGPLKGELAFDLGFSTYLAVKKVTDQKFGEGDIVTMPSPQPSPRGRGGINPNVGAWHAVPLQLKDATKSDLYTYQATVLQIIDGDTFHALVDLGFGVVVEEKLRLRMIDAPEILSSAGREAKTVLEKILARAGDGKVLIRTTQSDQFGRYLADIWVDGKNINQELLDSGVFELRSEYGD